MNKSYYPDDGGLKEPVRDISEVRTVATILVEHFLQKQLERGQEGNAAVC